MAIPIFDDNTKETLRMDELLNRILPPREI